LKSLDNKKIIEGIRSQDQYILKEIYSIYFPTIKRFVIESRGCEQDAKDVFQEAIIIIYRKIKEDKLILSSSFKSYLYSVCRFIWIKQFTTNKENAEKMEGFLEYDGIPDISTDEYKEHEQYKLYQKHFKRLEKDCQVLLQLFLKKVHLKDIAQKLNITSEQYIKRKKYKCKEQLVRYIKSDPNYIE
jgi:RNA polymerase sigma factor (sigma-70 family)